MALLAACSVDVPQGNRLAAEPPQAALSTTPVYSADIRPILTRHCASCHRQGTAAPFPLASYTDAQRRARQIADIVNSRMMPPWLPDSHGELLDENRLAAAEIATIRLWADRGGPAGASDHPPTMHMAAAKTADISGKLPIAAGNPVEPSGSALGKPDAVLSPLSATHIAADAPDFYRCTVLPTHFSEDKYLSAIVFQPGNPRTDQQALEYLDPDRQIRFLNAVPSGGGFTVRRSASGLSPSLVIGGWGISTAAHKLPSGTGILLPRGADIVLEVRYRSTGKPETDLPKVLLYFCRGPVKRQARVAPVLASGLRLSSHMSMESSGFGGQAPVISDISILGVMPCMRWQGASIGLSALSPDKIPRPLFSIPAWHFDQAGDYRFRNPVHVLQGSLLLLTAKFGDKHGGTEAVKDKPRTITWGDTIEDENAVAYVLYTSVREDLLQHRPVAGIPPLGGSSDSAISRDLLHMFDTDNDGLISRPETLAMRPFFGSNLPKMTGMDAM